MVDTRSTRRTQAPSTVPPPAKKATKKKPRKLSALRTNTTASKPKKKGPAARGNGAPVNDTSTQQAPLAPVENGEQNEDPTTAKQSEDVEPAANDQHIETEPQTSLQVNPIDEADTPSQSEPVPPPGRAASPNPPASLGLLPATPPLRPKPRPLPRTQQPDEERDPFDLSLRRRQAPTAGMRVQPVADEDELEELVKGREDRDEDELPDIPREDAEEEDWDIDLPAQDAAGALEATYTVQYGFDDYTGLAYDDDDSPRLPARSLQSPPRARSLSGTPIRSPRAHSLSATPTRSPRRARSFSATPTRSQAPDVDATGRATRPSLPCEESTRESERGRARTRTGGGRSVAAPALDLEDDQSSGDDYAAGVEKKSRARTQVLKYGGRVSPTTSDEDADDDQAMTDEGEMSPVGQPNAKPKPKPKPKTKTKPKTKPQAKGRAKAKAKGKAKAPELDVVDGDGAGSDGAGSDDEDEDEDEGHTRGPLSAEVRASLEVIQENFLTAIDDLAKSCGKSSQTLHRALGTTPKVGRAPSAWNVWQKWWADEEDAKNLPRGQFAKAARAALKVKCKIDDTFTEDMLNDSEAVFKRLPWLRKWHDTINAHALADIRSKGKLKGRLQREARALTQISKQLYNSYKVHCWGYVIDTQGDSSFVFGEGDDFKEMRQTQLHNLAQQMKDQEHMFGMIEMRKRGIQAQTVPSKTLVMQDNEKLRDLNRRQFISILANQLYACHVTAGQSPGDPGAFTMKWTRFLDVARQGQCRIENYPPALEQAGLIIGTPSFNIKKITSEMFAKFLPDMEKASKRPGEREEGDDEPVEAMAIVPWTDDECMLSLEEQAAIGIVLSVDGRVLAAVNHSDRYQKEVADAARKAEKEKGKGKRRRTQQQRGHDYDDSGRRPISPRAGRDDYDVRRHPERLHMQGPPYDDYCSRRDRSRSRSRSPGRGGRDGPTERRRSPSPSRSSRLVEYETSDRRRSRSRSSHRVKYGTTSRRRSRSRSPRRAEYGTTQYRRSRSPARAGPSTSARHGSRRSPSLPRRALSSRPTDPKYSHPGSTRGSRSPARKPQQVRVYGGSGKAGQPSLRMPPVPEDRTLAQDTRVRGEDLATARPQPLDEGERGRALADRVSGAAKRKAHPEGEGEDSERNPKRAREREIQEPRAEEGPAPLRMRFFVQDEMSRIFYARGLERVVKSSRADRHTLVDKQGEWVALRPHMTPKLASAADAEVYMREVERWGLEEPRPRTNLITQV
ncbi:hypothetical protein B0H14DRAFT_2556086 [Mycena olivaceomarginata]|nr:hypothetical protein B0H14DRAFT_2556086 [Mycena olivaceomarginata]